MIPPGLSHRWKTLEPLIDAAVETPAEQRGAFLDETCVGDLDLREELERLLAEYGRADPLLDHPAAETFSALLDDLAVPPRDLVNGNYRIEREIGRGGMATVYLAHDIRHDRKVAVKILHPELSAAFRGERFLAEIRTMAQLHHPHILPLHDSGEVDGILFYVMPYVYGETLRQRLEREKQLPVTDALRIIREVASALDSAHRHGVIHRDIKPENILLDEGGAVVADFGIALAVTAASSSVSALPGHIAGTPRYMSPEQTRGDRAIDGRSDVYSLAAVSNEMLAGISGAVDAIITRALSVTPDARYPTAGEFADALGKAIGARAPGHNRGRRSAAIALGIAVMALAAFGATRLRHEKAGSASLVLPASAESIGRHQTRNLAAYDLYQRGLDQALSRSDTGAHLAIQYFSQAIGLDSSYAAAYAELAHMYVVANLGGRSRGLSKQETVAKAQAAAIKAVSLDDSLADAHAELAFVGLFATLDMRLATRELSRAVSLDPDGRRPHEYLANLYEWTERPADALVEIRRANTADPLSVTSSIELASALYFNGQYDEALRQLDTLRRVRPPIRRLQLIEGSIYTVKKMWPEAIAVLRERQKAAGNDNLPSAFLGRTLALAGERNAAKQILAALIASSHEGEGAYGIAMVYEGLGDYDNAFVWLDKSIDDHSLWLNVMSPSFAKLRADPRFDRIRQRLNRTAESR
jgi:tRNA A-37 threonylcarbamoyl transferase component Bud32/tetratricopeptide (TPR) repeat protein